MVEQIFTCSKVGFHRWNLQRTEKDAPEKEDSGQSNP